MEMQTIAKNIMDNRAAIARMITSGVKDRGSSFTNAVINGVSKNRRAAAAGVGVLLIGGAAWAGYLLVSKYLSKESDAPAQKKKAGAKRASSKAVTSKVKAVNAVRKGQNQHFISPDKPAKQVAHKDEKHNGEKAAMRNENQKVKALTGNQKRKVLRIPGK